jgi:hypothetical protein
MQVPAPVVAAQVIKDGGTPLMAWVAAALVSGVESDGDPTELAGGIGPAAGLFQFEPGTWASNGGLAYGKVAQDATWQDQVQVYVNAVNSGGYYPWKPDLVPGGTYDGKPIPNGGGPQPGSAVYNTIGQLASTGALSFLGNVPANLADAGGVNAANPVPGPVGDVLGLATGGTVAADIASAWHQATGWATDLDQILSDLLSPAWWLRVGMGALGVVLFGVGLVGFISTTGPGQKATSDLGTAAKDAGVAAVLA